MIYFLRSFTLVYAILLCSVLSVNGKHSTSDPKKKDTHFDAKKQMVNHPTNHQSQKQSQSQKTVNPEMLLLSGTQKNDLNVIPLDVNAPKEALINTPDEKPIVISVSDDKQVLTEENRMLPKPILLDANFTNSEFFRNFWAKLNLSTDANNIVTTQRSATATHVLSKDFDEENFKELGQIRNAEMKSSVAANNLSRDVDDVCADPPVVNQTLTNEQLLCLVYRLLTVNKASFFDSCATVPPGPKMSKVNRMAGLAGSQTNPRYRPLDNVISHLQMVKNSSPLSGLNYKSPWNYQSSPPTDFGVDAASGVQKKPEPNFMDQIASRRTPNILDSIPMIRSFNELNSLSNFQLDKKNPDHSAPTNNLRTTSLLDEKIRRPFYDTDEQQRKGDLNYHLNNINNAHDIFQAAFLNNAGAMKENVSQINRYTELNGHNNDALKQFVSLSNITARRPAEPVPYSGVDTSNEDNFYAKFFKQLQENSGSPNSQFGASDRSKQNQMDLLNSLTRLHSPVSKLDHPADKNFSVSSFKTPLLTARGRPSDKYNYLHLLKGDSAPDKNFDVNLFNKPSSGYFDPGKIKKDTFNFADQMSYYPNNFKSEKLTRAGISSGKITHSKEVSKNRKKEKQPDDKKRKKFQLAIKKKTKDERKRKGHDLDFLDLLSKSMIRESKNFRERL